MYDYNKLDLSDVVKTVIGYVIKHKIDFKITLVGQDLKKGQAGQMVLGICILNLT
jgi:hypothetical protein